MSKINFNLEQNSIETGFFSFFHLFQEKLSNIFTVKLMLVKHRLAPVSFKNKNIYRKTFLSTLELCTKSQRNANEWRKNAVVLCSAHGEA